MNFAYNDFIYICASNSNGYFVADSIDIFLDNKNIKRKVYIRHHIMAILGISTVYLGDNKFILAIWCLEIGGILHHIKYMSEVYSFNYFFRIFITSLYFLIYPISRLYFILNVFQGLYDNLTFINLINTSVSTLLFLQNVIWLFRNFKNLKI